MRTAFINTLMDLAQNDPKLWLLTADLGYSVLEPFAATFPDRYVNVGIAEQNLMGIAAGLARCGLHPFVYSIANFPTLRCLEQIRNDVCYHEGAVTIVAVGGGLAYGPQGYTHHGVEEVAILRSLPGMTVVAPGDPVETRLATRALAEHAGPSYLRLGKANEPIVHQQEPAFTLGKVIELQAGHDLTIISTGAMLADSVAACQTLRAQGIEPRLLSMPTIKPLDEDAVLRAARETGAILTVEEHNVNGGLGSAVADVVVSASISIRFRKLGIPDQPYHLIGSQSFLKKRLIGDIAEAALELLRRHAATGQLFLPFPVRNSLTRNEMSTQSSPTPK